MANGFDMIGNNGPGPQLEKQSVPDVAVEKKLEMTPEIAQWVDETSSLFDQGLNEFLARQLRGFFSIVDKYSLDDEKALKVEAMKYNFDLMFGDFFEI